MTAPKQAEAHSLRQQGLTLREVGKAIDRSAERTRQIIRKEDRRQQAVAKLAADPLDIRALQDAGLISRRLATGLLYHLNITRLDELSGHGEQRVRATPYLGPRSMAELAAAMEKHGISYNPNPWAHP